MRSSNVVMSAAVVVAFAGGWGTHASWSRMDTAPANASALPSPPAETQVEEPARFFCPDRPSRDEGAAMAGQLVLEYLRTGDPARCEQAIRQFTAAESSDYYGSESDSLAWFCQYALATPDGRAELEQNIDGARFVRLFSPDNWARLRFHLENKYYGGPAGHGSPDARFNDEFLRFNSPTRAKKDHADKIMDLLDLKPGDTVGDIGAGAGFYAYRFAAAVGPAGRVYAVELNPLDMQYMRQVARDESMANFEVVEGTEGTVGLGRESVDVLFLSSTFHTIYGRASRADRQSFVASMKSALKPGGRVVVVENTPTDELPEGQSNPYVGYTISRKLLVDYLGTRGFRLVQDEQFVPQRYLLSWELTNAANR